MDGAREILGVEQDWLGFVDSGLPEGDPLPPLPEGCFALVASTRRPSRWCGSIRAFRPHVMTTYDENGGYPHPDHIMCHKISMVAFDAAGDPERYPEAGPPWQPLKLYYNQSFHRQRTQALHDAMLERGLESPYGEWLARVEADPEHDDRITTHVPCAEFFPVRDRALLAHATQIDPDGAVVPRARSRCTRRSGRPRTTSSPRRSSTTELPEDDLFAGLRT